MVKPRVGETDEYMVEILFPALNDVDIRLCVVL